MLASRLLTSFGRRTDDAICILPIPPFGTNRPNGNAMQVRLTRKLANCLNGIDVSRFREGDIVDLTPHDAALLIAEGWAAPYVPSLTHPIGSLDGDGNVPAREPKPASPPLHEQGAEPSRRSTRTLDQLRKVREELEQQRLGEQEHRRIEDQIREDLRDSRAIIIDKEDDKS